VRSLESANVAPRTVSKWFDTGQLRGYRIPGSKDRRIPLSQLVRFMKAHGIPLDQIETGRTRVLIVDADADLARLLEKAMRSDLTMNGGGFFGLRSRRDDGAAQARDCAGGYRRAGIEGRALSRFITGRGELAGTQVIATERRSPRPIGRACLHQGIHNTIAKPFNVQELAT